MIDEKRIGDECVIDCRVYTYKWPGHEALYKNFGHHNVIIENLLRMGSGDKERGYAVISYGDRSTLIPLDYLDKTRDREDFPNYKDSMAIFDGWNKFDESSKLQDGWVLVCYCNQDIADLHIGLMCGVVHDGKIVVDGKYDISNIVIAWHRIPGIICRDRLFFWEDSQGKQRS